MRPPLRRLGSNVLGHGRCHRLLVLTHLLGGPLRQLELERLLLRWQLELEARTLGPSGAAPHPCRWISGVAGACLVPCAQFTPPGRGGGGSCRRTAACNVLCAVHRRGGRVIGRVMVPRAVRRLVPPVLWEPVIVPPGGRLALHW
ncbi:MAG: hypothetical protein ACK55Z_36975, partial [bacterium]